MHHAESADDELAIIRRKLERAKKQLAEKDLEITVLKKELASLRQGHSPTDLTEESSTPSHAVDDDKGSNW